MLLHDSRFLLSKLSTFTLNPRFQVYNLQFTIKHVHRLNIFPEYTPNIAETVSIVKITWVNLNLTAQFVFIKIANP